MIVHPDRIRIRAQGKEAVGPVVYWMSRDQRIHDNWALLYAQQIAIEKKRSLLIVHNLHESFLGGARRQFDWKVRGLQEVAKEAEKYNMPFFLFHGKLCEREMKRFFHKIDAASVVTDFSPLRIQQSWIEEIIADIQIPFFEVDAHNIVPVWSASDKQEFAARTIRPKIHRQLMDFLEPFPPLQKHPHQWKGAAPETAWQQKLSAHSIDRIDWIEPGMKAAKKTLQHFIDTKLRQYSTSRNDPAAQATSLLSPYLHYGHISAQRIALAVTKSAVQQKEKEVFLEELIVRKELADNFCFYNSAYDSFDGFPQWAQKTLAQHAKDPREFCYSIDDFEQAQTHDPLWNAAQTQLVQTAHMHGYMRMYWAKKILEWTASPQEAMQIAIILNDRYELDGRDPNGYVGIAWSIGGVHDRPWFDRPIFGTVRYMNANGMRRKFDVERYMQLYQYT